MVATRRAIWLARLAALGLGAGLVLTQPIYSLWWMLLCLPGLHLLWHRAETARQAFFIGWFAGVAYFGLGLVWIAEAFLVEADIFAWMIPIAMPLLAGGLALFWAAGFALGHRVGHGHPMAPVLFAVCWMLGETVRSFALTGFPWGLLGYAWVEVPPMQTAALFGIHGVTLLTLLAGALLGAAMVGRGSARLANAALGLAVIGVMWGYGSLRLETQEAESEAALQIGIVQPNISQDRKWRPELREAHLSQLLDQTSEAVGKGARIVVWPEAATAFPIAEMPQILAAIAERLPSDGLLLTGSLRVENRGLPEAKVYNSVLAIHAAGQVVGQYDKRHLVPFGEYLPFDDLLTRLGLRALATLPGGLSAGEADSKLMQITGVPTFGTLVCYEAIFADEILRRNSKARWLLHVTNDAWFGATSGPYQHLAQTRVRAIERGLPIARSANTGVSAVIDSRGRVGASIALGQRSVVVSQIRTSGSDTLYGQFEELVFILLMVVFSLTRLLRQN